MNRPWTTRPSTLQAGRCRMADTRVEEAVNVVARRLIVDDARFIGRGNWNDLSQHGWALVVARMIEIAGEPSGDEYEAAFDFLVARKDEP